MTESGHSSFLSYAIDRSNGVIVLTGIFHIVQVTNIQFPLQGVEVVFYRS